MATIPNRYSQLAGLMPRGQFWDALGAVIPKRNTPYQFLFETGIANRRFGVFDNDVFKYVVVTDALGEAVVTLDLGIGEHTIRIEDDVTANQFKAYATVRAYATWHAAYAEVLESLDLSIEQIYEGSHLEQSISLYLGEFWGREVGQTNNLLYATETFRGVLWNLRQAYRWYGATKHGLQQAVWAFTSSSPWIVPRLWRARWILDTPLLPNFDLQTFVRTLPAPTLPYVLPDDLFQTINDASYLFVHDFYADTDPNVFPGPIQQPPTPQTLNVTYQNGWDGGDVTIAGTTVTGEAISETIPAGPLPVPTPVALLVQGTQVFSTITSITKSVVAGIGSVAIVGLSTSRFVKLESLNSLFFPSPIAPIGSYQLTLDHATPSIHAAYNASFSNTFPGPITQPLSAVSAPSPFYKYMGWRRRHYRRA